MSISICFSNEYDFSIFSSVSILVSSKKLAKSSSAFDCLFLLSISSTFDWFCFTLLSLRAATLQGN